jgi:hypothetical protein
MNIKKIVPMEYADLMYQMGFNQALASVKTIIDPIVDDTEQKQMIFDLIEYISYTEKL